MDCYLSDAEQIVTRLVHEERALKFLSLKKEYARTKEPRNKLETALKTLATLLRKEVSK